MERDDRARHIQQTKETVSIMRPLKYLLILCFILLYGCNGNPETDYYSISLGEDFEIKELPRYESDSVAIAEETKRSNDFDRTCMEKLEENVQAMREAVPKTGLCEIEPKISKLRKVGRYSEKYRGRGNVPEV